MRLAIVYNEPEPTAPERHWRARSNPGGVQLPADFRDSSEFGVLAQVADIERALRRLGAAPIVHAAASGAALAEFLGRERPDVVFNCCESLRGDASLELNVAALFDLYGVAYTGSTALALGIALDKSLAKALFQAKGIPTPRHVVMETAADLDCARFLTYPLIVKPVAEDASIGIDDGAVVHDRDALASRVRFVCSTFQQSAIVEEFIDGRELNVALLAGPRGDFRPLPISEVSFDALPGGAPRIVGYDAKWVPDSTAYQSTPVRCPATLDCSLADRVRSLAVSAARTLGLRDYARVDIRVRAGDESVFVLEANPNPDLSADAGFMRAALASGRTFTATVQQILACAIERARTRAVTAGMS